MQEIEVPLSALLDGRRVSTLEAWQHLEVDQPAKAVTDEDLWEMIEDFVLMEVLRERLGEQSEP